MRLEQIEEVWSQEGDCCGSPDDQYLKIKTEDGGGGPFLVISTERWALDEGSIDELTTRLRKVLARATRHEARAEREEREKEERRQEEKFRS